MSAFFGMYINKIFRFVAVPLSGNKAIGFNQHEVSVDVCGKFKLNNSKLHFEILAFETAYCYIFALSSTGMPLFPKLSWTYLTSNCSMFLSILIKYVAV